MEKILVATRGGLGDQIICNGLINHWSETKFVYLTCRLFTLETLTCLYKDNPNVEIRPIGSRYLGLEHEKEINALGQVLQIKPIGVCTHDISLLRYQECMYEWLAIPFEYRYSKFRLPNEIPKRKELYDKLKPNKKYALISNLGSSGFNKINWDEHIDPNLDRLFLGPVTDNLLDWIDLIMEAEEIHCIPSGPFHFVDSIWSLVKGQKFFHNSRSGTNFNPNNEHNQHCWKVIKYDKKTSA
jgi:hypothetical protein